MWKRWKEDEIVVEVEAERKGVGEVLNILEIVMEGEDEAIAEALDATGGKGAEVPLVTSVMAAQPDVIAVQ